MDRKKAIKFSQVRKLLASGIPERDKVWFNLSFTYGLRIKELILLKKDNINEKEGTIYIERVKGSVSRVYPLLIDTTNFEPLPPCESEKDIQVRRVYINRLYTKHTKRILKERFTAHCFRHGCACFLLEKSRDIKLVQDWLGHKQINNTVVYTQRIADPLKGAIKFFKN